MPLPTDHGSARSPVEERGPGVAAIAGAVLAGAVLIGAALRPGYALYLDHVAVPTPAAPQWDVLTDATAGALRSWPLDGLQWLWSQILPIWTLQHLILIAATVGAGVGAGLVLRSHGAIAAFTAAVLAVANPYVVERLLLGQGALLLGYAAMPWIIVATRQRTTGRRVGLGLLATGLAAITPWGGVVAAATLLTMTVARRRTATEISAVVGGGVLLNFAWLVPAVLAAGGLGADPAGARAFALGDELGWGVFTAALVGGGVWSGAAQVLPDAGAMTIVGIVAVVGAAAVGAWSLFASSRRRMTALVSTYLLVPAVGAFLSGPGLGLWAQAQAVPGMALFRDLHRVLAPSTLALSLLAALGVQQLVRMVAADRVLARVALAVVLPAALAALLVPAGPIRVERAYQQAWYPADWEPALIAAQPSGDERVLSLPWQPLRRASWAPGTFLDPTPKALGAGALVDRRLTVLRDGETIVVPDRGGGVRDDTLATLLTTPGPHPLLSDLLVSSHVSRVLVWKQSPGVVPDRPESWSRVFSSENFEVWEAPTAIR